MMPRHSCVERALPRFDAAPIDDSDDEFTFSDVGAGDGSGTKRSRAAFFTQKLWENGSTLNVRFVGGTLAQRRFVRSVAPEWSKYANLTLRFIATKNRKMRADIRVAFKRGVGSWSYVGTDARQIPQEQPTLNLGWLHRTNPRDRGVVLHEFGHAIGLVHEHQNPKGGIEWNREAVVEALSGPPNHWDEATIEHNVFSKYNAADVTASDVDDKSIMMYPFPAEWTRNGVATPTNDDLSPTDRAFAGVVYPRNDEKSDGESSTEQEDEPTVPPPSPPKEPTLAVTTLDTIQKRLQRPNQRHVYRVDIKERGFYVIETHGATDVMAALYGPENKRKRVKFNNNGGTGKNARIAVNLKQTGTYYVAIRHAKKKSGVGAYKLSCSRVV